MLFSYKTVDDKGTEKSGKIDAPGKDAAISALQRRGLIVLSVREEKAKGSIFQITFFDRVKMKDVVILSRQISTLFEAQVSALKAFTMLAANSENRLLGTKLNQVSEDIKAGVTISGALARHPDVFSNFYVNMVRAGEETGKLDQTFSYLASYLDRQYTLTSKTRNALIYPTFVIFTFFAVMILMFTLVIPKLSDIIVESGQEVPVYTKIVIAVSNFFVDYGFLLLIFVILGGVWLWRMSKTKGGRAYLDKLKLSLPVVGNLYKKLYLSRISDNLDTMLGSGIPIVRSIDITGDVVNSSVYKRVMNDVAEDVKSGDTLSSAFEKHPIEIPPILVQMVKVGEETGSLGKILKTLSEFYKREVDDAIDTMIGLIEPVMIVILGFGVGVLLISILLPIYNIAGGIT